MPKVSVVLPVYNAEQFVDEAIDSVLRQSLADFELIAIDDGSTDNSAEIISRRAHDDHRIRFIAKSNSGLASTLNLGLELASAMYIARMDADDFSEPTRLEAQYNYMVANPRVCLLGSQITRISGADGKVLDVSSFPLDHNNILRGLRRGVHVMAHPAVMFKATTAARVGGYWEYGAGEDWDFYLKMSEWGSLVNLDSSQLRYRFHGSGINATSLSELRTNIVFAIRRQDWRMADEPGLTRNAFLAELSFLDRWRIYTQTQSLTYYRRAIACAGSARRRDQGARYLLLLAAISFWPAQAIRRIVSTVGRGVSRMTSGK